MSGAPRAQVLLIEACDFEGFPVGGHLTTLKQMITLFGERLALVGLTTDATPVGRWTKRRFGAVELDYFSLGRVAPTAVKPLIPRRLWAFCQLKRFKPRILAHDARAAFVIAPEVMLAVEGWGLRIAYTFAGVENALRMPRYAIGKWLAGPFERRLFRALAERAELILAAADAPAIEAMRARSGGLLAHKRVVPCPTRVDTEIFRVIPQARSADAPVLITCGRLNHVKGWDLVLEAFALLKARVPGASLVFVGDGEDREKLAAQVRRLELGSSVRITGFLPAPLVAGMLNSADLFVAGSHREGWPTAVVEAAACGLPIVCTDVSGAADLVKEGCNGFVVKQRDAAQFARCMAEALTLERPNAHSLRVAQAHSLEEWRVSLPALWPPLADASIAQRNLIAERRFA